MATTLMCVLARHALCPRFMTAGAGDSSDSGGLRVQSSCSCGATRLSDSILVTQSDPSNAPADEHLLGSANDRTLQSNIQHGSLCVSAVVSNGMHRRVVVHTCTALIATARSSVHRCLIQNGVPALNL